MESITAFLGSAGDLVLVLLGFGLIIFVHELGHFLAARWAGIRVLAFAIGFGPPLVTYRKGLGLRRGSSEAEYFEWQRRHPEAYPRGAGPDLLSPTELRPFIAGVPRGIYLWGCNVAAAAISGHNIIQGTLGTLDSGWGAGENAIRNGAGFRLMLAIANLLGAPVHAALDMQFIQAQWRFVGSTITVHPGGTFTQQGN